MVHVCNVFGVQQLICDEVRMERAYLEVDFSIRVYSWGMLDLNARKAASGLRVSRSKFVCTHVPGITSEHMILYIFCEALYIILRHLLGGDRIEN